MSVEEVDPIENLKKAGVKRLRHPFYFSLLVSFAVLNWRAIYILLLPAGSLDAEQRIDAIQHLYDPWWAWHLLKVFVGPIFFACMYVTYIPRWIFRLERFQRRDRVKQLNEIKEIDGGLSETQRIIGELAIEKDRYQKEALRALDEKTAAVREKDDLMKNYTDSLQQQNKLRSEYLHKMGQLIPANERMKNVFNAIAKGTEWKDHTNETAYLRDIYQLI